MNAVRDPIAAMRARLDALVRERGAVPVAPGRPSPPAMPDPLRERARAGVRDEVPEGPTPPAAGATALRALASHASLAAQVDQLRQLQRVRETRRRTAEAALPGTVVADGVREIRADHPLGDDIVRALAPGRAAPCWEREDVVARGPLVFFDTETTGLAGGTGTLVFLFGAAWADGERLHLRQWLLTSPGAERAWLAAITDALPADALLVSFNGKTFDLPLMAARYRLARLRDPFASRAHWDLMHPLKRAYDKRWPDCRLQTAERRLLGHERIDDLPGAYAPQAFTAYLRHGETRMLAEVVRHNATDIVSLAKLLAALERVYADPDHHGADVAAIAARLARAGRDDDAVALLEGNTHDLAVRRQLATRRSREQRWDDARALLAPLADAKHPCPQALERLAKIAEHVERDFAKAIALATRLAALEPSLARHGNRLARLRRRLGAMPARADANLPATPGREGSHE